MFRRLKTICLVIGGCLSPGIGLSAAEVTPQPAAVQAETRDAVLSLWEGYRSEISTAEVQYLRLYFHCTGTGLTAEGLASALDDLDLTADDQLARRVLQRFRPDLLSGEPDVVQRNVDRVCELRTVLLRGAEFRNISPVFEHVRSSDLHLLADHRNQDVQAFHPGRCRYWVEDIHWFRTVPEDSILNVKRELTASGDELRVQLTGLPGEKGSILVLDAVDALPRRVELVYPQTGTLTRLELYREYATYPGNILAPAIHVQAGLQQERIERVIMTLIRSARFNVDLDDSRFRLEVPTGWAWFDHRSDPERSGTWPVPVTDVEAFFNSQPTEVTAARPIQDPLGSSLSGSFSWRSICLAGNGVLLVAVGLFLWRRTL